MDLYGTLEVGKDATQNEIRKAFMKKALRCHPDKNPGVDPEPFLELKKAYDVLMDAKKRKFYDRTGKIGDVELEDRVEISIDDIEAFVKSYKASDEEDDDLLNYARKNKGDVTRILESIIASEDDDIQRYVSKISEFFKAKKLPKKFKKTFIETKDKILSLAELDDGLELESEDEEDQFFDDDDDDEDVDDLFADDDDEDEEDNDPPEAKIDLVDSPEKSRPTDDVPSDLVAMFAARRANRESQFDAFAKKWQTVADHEATLTKEKKKKAPGAEKKKKTKKRKL